MTQSLIYNVALLFLMMIPGILMVRCRLSTEGFGKALSNLVLYIAQPALIVSAYIRPYDPEIMINACWVLLFSFLSHLLFSAIAFRAFRRAPDGKKTNAPVCNDFFQRSIYGHPAHHGGSE